MQKDGYFFTESVIFLKNSKYNELQENELQENGFRLEEFQKYFFFIICT